MSGHSKWKNIMHKKGKTDAQRASVFTKISKEIIIAVKAGGGDPNSNSKLRELIIKAKANNVPNDNIDRTIKKALGNDSTNYEEITYEGYGPGGVAVIVKAATDNRNRTAGDVRHYFDKFGGNMGTTGCVSFMFTEKGLIIISDEDEELDEDKLMEDAMECGAEDFVRDGDIYEIYTETADLYDVRDSLVKLGYTVDSADPDMVPSTYVTLDDEETARHMGLLLDTLEDNDDVQNVYHNWKNCD